MEYPNSDGVRDPLFAQLDAWKAKGYAVTFTSASRDLNTYGIGDGAGWALRLETPQSHMMDDRICDSPHVRVTTAVCATPEEAIRAMLLLVQP